MREEGLTRRELFKVLREGRRRSKRHLRPPGTVEEGLFLTLCNGCGDCMKACPYKSLKMVEGSPRFKPRESPCYLCEDFPCIRACRTGALKAVEGRGQVRVGTAILRKADCLAWGGADCQMCFIRCPLTGEAITLEDFKPFIREDRCTGCGVCEYVCATVNNRNAVTVVALSDRERAQTTEKFA
ncbi:MAG: 4Fe-4S dicluster domain-containing protein [Candidatus Binatia bacterium]